MPQDFPAAWRTIWEVPRVPANEAPTNAKTMAETATMARLPSSAWAAERERPRPVLMSATPAMASGASMSSASVSAKTASLMTGIAGMGTGGFMGGFLRAPAYVLSRQQPNPWLQQPDRR